MLKNWNRPEKPEEEELEERLRAARAKLGAQQMLIKEHKLPVLKAGVQREKAVSWGRLSGTLTPDFSRWQPWTSPQRKKSGNHFCIGIL